MALHALTALASQPQDPKALCKLKGFALVFVETLLSVICFDTKCLHVLKFSSLVQLQELDLGSNGLVGSLPETWGNLSSVSLLVALMG